MDPNPNVETIIQGVYKFGRAHLEIEGERYFRDKTPKGDKIRPAHEEWDNYEIDGGENHPLIELGRKFPNLEEALHYVDALTCLDLMMCDAEGAVTYEDPLASKRLTEKIRKIHREGFAECQKALKEKYLPILQTIPRFRKQPEFWNMTPEQIHKHSLDYKAKQKKK